MSGSAALFVKQQLRTRQDMLVLGQILNDAMQDYIEVRNVVEIVSPKFLVSRGALCAVLLSTAYSASFIPEIP